MLFLTLSLIGAITLVLYLYLIWDFNYWKKRGVSGPKPTILLGTIPNALLQKRNLYYDINDTYLKYKGNAFAGIFLIRTPQLLAIEPEFVKEIMITNFKNFHDNDLVGVIDKDTDPLFGRNPFMLEGNEWKEKRAEITPAFTPSRIKFLFPLIEDICIKMTKYVKVESDKKPIDGIECKELAAKFTTDVVSSCIFDTDAKSFTDDEAVIRKMGKGLIASDWKAMVYFILLFIFPFIKNFWKISLITKKSEIFFTNLMENAVLYRELNKINRSDYLNFLIQLKEKKNLTSLDMAAHGVTFFLDGFETSSIVISYAFYELAKNKRVQDKLRNEIKEYIITHGKIDYDVINEMPYLDQVFYEALRMHPPLFNLSRRCTETIEITGSKDKKLLIEKGVAVIIPVLSIQTDPEHYENPHEFYPERFNPENGGVKAFRDKCVLLPFGDGPRICLGMRFAVAQAKAGLVEIVKSFELSVNKKTLEPLQLDPKEFLTIAYGGLWVDFKAI